MTSNLIAMRGPQHMQIESVVFLAAFPHKQPVKTETPPPPPLPAHFRRHLQLRRLCLPSPPPQQHHHLHSIHHRHSIHLTFAMASFPMTPPIPLIAAHLFGQLKLFAQFRLIVCRMMVTGRPSPNSTSFLSLSLLRTMARSTITFMTTAATIIPPPLP